LVEVQQETGEFETEDQVDENGITVLDENGDPVQVIKEEPLLDINGDEELDGEGNVIMVPVLETEPVSVPASMTTAGALSSTTFMSRFESGATHEGYLSTAEMKLISEWLDLGAQYYNNPIDAPAN